MSIAEAETMATQLPGSRAQREQQLLEAMERNPMEVYAAYLNVFGTAGADAPTLTPLAMVRCLLEREFPKSTA